MSSGRRLSRSYKRRMKRRALLVAALIGLTVLCLYMSLHWHQSNNSSGIRATMPDQGGDG